MHYMVRLINLDIVSAPPNVPSAPALENRFKVSSVSDMHQGSIDPHNPTKIDITNLSERSV